MASHNCRKLMYIFRCMFFFSLVIFVMSTALMELIVAPFMVLKYYSPSLLRHGVFANYALTAYYVACIVVQVLNLMAAVALFLSVLLTGYTEKWLAFDTISLVSGAISVALIMQSYATGINLYEAMVEPDIYYQMASVGDQRCGRAVCSHTDVYVWHNENQCCGWRDPRELLGLPNAAPAATHIGFKSSRNESDLMVAAAIAPQDRLPNYCCYSVESDGYMAKPAWAKSSSCHMESPLRFTASCAFNGTAVFALRSVSIVSHPASEEYAVLKLVAALAYAFVKKHSFFPQGEGVYSYYVQN